ncbi:MAG: oligopeptide/dipeptide ABC transporter ATP-binding protein, partial [Actinomycetota bacterium]
AVPVPDPEVQRSRRRVVLQGDIPSPMNPPSGCSFHTRCPIVEERNKVEEPVLRDVGGGHEVACHLVGPSGEAPKLVEETEGV